MKSIRLLLPLATIALICPACGPTAAPTDLSRLNHHSDALIAFDFPGNWRITTNEDRDFGRFLILEGKKNSVVTLTIYSTDWDAEFGAYCEAFASSLATSIPIGKIVEEKWAEATSPRQNEQARDFAFSIQLASVKVPNTANFWKQVHGDVKVIGVSQVPDEDRPDIEAGFQLIRDTLAVSK